ncbi:hypothetical protein L593_00030 [Salinarchaeum sp. Harcht-Bsk1]|uniref:DUF7524 family protein n=1 Tax=Salinarchaeum sp. Harcht-Bsk1 TaxID=1333523 RepID=UPI0003423EB9|nr:hypothetical protein [Salinarchaeum sp. Harcht-Bsk1]AGM99960.1 hypothetical protein L593_00030 [Salinarchaeum sp. Harcht-Bsk1]
MTDALAVHLNRSKHHAIEPASDSFETDGPFVVRIQNHGEGSHVHCSLSGDLATTATITDGNPFLEPDDVVDVPIDVRTDLRPARGTLELSTGYGRESVAVDVLVRESGALATSPIEHEQEDDGAEASRSTGAPVAAEDSTGPPETEYDTSTAVEAVRSSLQSFAPRADVWNVLLFVLAAIAIVIAAFAWGYFDSLAVKLGVVLVFATVQAAFLSLLRQ